MSFITVLQMLPHSIGIQNHDVILDELSSQSISNGSSLFDHVLDETSYRLDLIHYPYTLATGEDSGAQITLLDHAHRLLSRGNSQNFYG